MKCPVSIENFAPIATTSEHAAVVYQELDDIFDQNTACWNVQLREGLAPNVVVCFDVEMRVSYRAYTVLMPLPRENIAQATVNRDANGIGITIRRHAKTIAGFRHLNIDLE